MRTNLNFVQDAVIGGLGVILALSNGAADAVVCGLVFHNLSPIYEI